MFSIAIGGRKCKFLLSLFVRSHLLCLNGSQVPNRVQE